MKVESRGPIRAIDGVGGEIPGKAGVHTFRKQAGLLSSWARIIRPTPALGHLFPRGARHEAS